MYDYQVRINYYLYFYIGLSVDLKITKHGFIWSYICKVIIKRIFWLNILISALRASIFFSALRADYLALRSVDFKITKHCFIWSYIRKVILKRIFLKKTEKNADVRLFGRPGDRRTHRRTHARTDNKAGVGVGFVY